MKNSIIRNLLLERGIKQWQLAKMLGMGETTLSRKLRNELPEDEKQRILEVINEYPPEERINS